MRSGAELDICRRRLEDRAQQLPQPRVRSDETVAVFDGVETRGPCALFGGQQLRQARVVSVRQVQAEADQATETRTVRIGSCGQLPALQIVQRLMPDARRGSSVTAFSGRGSSVL